ncbi:MAG: Phospho-2-dehydro-3-deoxyheptonate aldolase, Tyr-sensitive [Chlamydiae bacterium]|nr:Phospho-2-dehydro-3-deoxyheptonate aldolase, Tyr-sensitive [Chlamydiota bacterium]
MHLTSPIELKHLLPLSSNSQEFIREYRNQVIRILERQDNRLLIIVGPCSIHNVEEGLAYGKKIRELAREVEESCLLVMRANIEKPRTSSGWQGLVHDPYLNGSNDIDRGLYMARSLLISLAEMEVPTATEFLSPSIAPYVEDLVTWGWIGARTSSSQVHRILASSLPMPIGFKNTVDGNTTYAVNGALVAREPQTFLHIDETGTLKKTRSKGNAYTHVVLRGSNSQTNYDPQSIENTLEALRRAELPARVMVDCSHGNSQRKYFKQKEVFANVLKQIEKGNTHIIGMMLESHLEGGSQTIPKQLSDLQTGVSVTDPCLDYSSTAELIRSVKSSLFSSTEMSLTHS